MTTTEPLDPVLTNPPILDRFRLDGRVALVTGAGQGIGRAFAHALGEAGAAVAVADIDGDKATVVAAELAAKGISSLALTADVTDPAAVEAMVAAVVSGLGRLDIAVNNAGINFNSAAEDTSLEVWDQTFNINTRAVFVCCQAEAKVMIPQGSGCIINTASMASLLVPHPQKQAAYNVSKAAVAHLTRSLATEWAEYGIRVNAMSPGIVRTPLIESAALAPLKDIWLEQIPAKRLAEVTDLQGAIVFLASDVSDYMIGQNLAIEGGPHVVVTSTTHTIKLGVAQWSLPIDGPWGCRVAADSGLDGVQLDVGDASRGFPLTRQSTQDAWQQAASDAGVELISVAINALCRHGMNVRPDSDDGRMARAAIAAGIRAARDLGLDLVQLPAFEGGFVRTAEERENLADALRFACRLAADVGITVSSENVLDPGEFRELRERVAADNFRLFFDMQNYVLNRGLDQLHVLDELFDDVVQVHAKDGVDGRLSSAVVGTGDAHVVDQIQMLLDRGYGGWITLENFYDTAPIAGGSGDPVADLAIDAAALRRLVDGAAGAAT